MRNSFVVGAFSILLLAQPVFAQQSDRDRALAKADKQFARYDKDNNGKLDTTEIQSMLQDRATRKNKTMKPKAVAHFIRQADGNADGAVSREEFKTAAGVRFDKKAAKAATPGAATTPKPAA